MRQPRLQFPPRARTAVLAAAALAALGAGCRDVQSPISPARPKVGLHKDLIDADAGASAVVSDGATMLGVGQHGQLGVTGPVITAVVGSGYPVTTNYLGLRTADGSAEAFSEGSEGWGIADGLTRAAGGVVANSPTAFVPTVESFSSTTTGATSVVRAAGTFRVTHEFHPAAQAPALYEVVVTVENTSAAATDVHYRRIVNWYPVANGSGWGPPYAVSAVGSGQPQVERVASQDCDNDPRPLAAHAPSDTAAGGENFFCHPQWGDFALTAFFDETGQTAGVNVSPVYDFALGSLAPGAKLQFRLYYGAAGSESAMLAALAAAGVKTYTTARRADGPATFAFGFAPAAPSENHLVVVRDSGVVGTPTPMMGDTVIKDTAFAYQFALAPGYRNLQVLVDGQVAPASGRMRVDSGSVLIVSADRIPTVPADAGPLAQALRDVLASGNPVRAYQRYLDLTADYATRHSGADLIDSLRELEFAVIDPVADSAAIARVDAALAGHDFDLSALGAQVAAGPLANRSPTPDRSGTAAAARDLVTVRFVNGIFNGERGASGSAEELELLVGETPGLREGLTSPSHETLVRYFYNRNVGDQNVAARCFAYAAGRQGVLGKAGHLAFLARCLGTAPARFLWEMDLTEAARQYANLRGWVGATYTQSPDVKPLADLITRDRRDGRHELLVPHSQGNLLVGQALNSLANDGAYNPGLDPYCVGVVSLAAPTRAGLEGTIPADQFRAVAVRGDIVVGIGNTPTLDNEYTEQRDQELANLDALAKRPYVRLGTPAIRALIAARKAFWGLQIHGVMDSYFKQPRSRAAIVTAMGDVYRGCTAASFSLSPAAVTTASHTQVTLTGALLNGFGRQLPDRPLAWSSDAPDVARVSGDGVLSAGRAGAATVAAETREGWRGTTAVTVAQP